MRKLNFDKKYIPAFILAAACVVVGVLCAIRAVDEIKYNEFIKDSSLIDLNQTVIIADGGNGTDIPKNTIYAIEDLVAKQFTAMKIDARLTKDKKWVSLESDDISSVTDGKGSVGDYNYFDLLNYNIRNFKPREAPVIELVSETARHAYENSISPVIFFHDYNKSSAKALLTTLKDSGVHVLAFASDNIKVLQHIRKLDKDVSLFYYVDAVTDDAIEECKNDSNMSLCFNAANKSNNDVQIEKMTVQQVSFLCYGAETLNDIEKLYKFGVRRFITDTVKVG